MKKLAAYGLLHIIIFIYSLSSICSKTAAVKEFMSLEWIMLYGAVVILLGIYALFWQQVLKKIPLNIGYANKSVTIIWGTIFGIMLFEETISVTNIIGIIIVLVGVILMVTGGEKNNE